MGSTLSTISSEHAISLLVVVGAVGLGLGYSLRSPVPVQPPLAESAGVQASKKKQKKKKTAGTAQSDLEGTRRVIPAQVVAFPDVVPGQFDSAPEPTSDLSLSQLSTAGKSKKPKKKKAKAQEAEPSAPIPIPSEDQKVAAPSTKAGKGKSQKANSKGSSGSTALSAHETSAVETDGSWTRVDARRKGDSVQHRLEASISDANTTPVTGNSSPVAERTEDETLSPNPRASGENRRTLAEKLLPKARKTGVEDLLDMPDVPTLSRVMRIKPGPDEKPASGFSWADYEDVRVTDGGENDADGEDDGWGVVKGRKPKGERLASSGTAQQSKSSTPEPASKKQRQNAQKRDAQKAAKAAAEEERLAALARHKRELERSRMAEQAKKSSGKTVSGGMKATVDERGKLVWE